MTAFYLDSDPATDRANALYTLTSNRVRLRFPR